MPEQPLIVALVALADSRATVHIAEELIRHLSPSVTTAQRSRSGPF